jgi:hypothetical protein
MERSVRALNMAQHDHRCQSRAARGVVIALLLSVPAMAQSVTSSSNDRQARLASEKLARQTVAARFAVPADRLTVVSVSPAQWRDSSLGCPERGTRYTPSLTSGYEVKLRDAEQMHVVHVAGGRAVLCGVQTDARLPAATMVGPTLKAAQAVRAALAARLDLDPSNVQIPSTRPFRGATSQCPSAPRKQSGAALIVDAEANGQSFRYYFDEAVVVSCDETASKPR